MLDEYSTVSVVVIDTVVNALLYILSGLFIIKGEFTIGGAFAFITYSAYVVNPISALINIKLKNKTIVFITHKYKELESVDKVYRLSKGILELVRS